jgi:thioredoxin reductase
VIISTGAQARWLGLENEEKFQGHGYRHALHAMDSFLKIEKLQL